MVQRAGVDQDPIAHLLDSLHLAYQLVGVWGTMVAAIDERAEEEAEEREFLRGELGYDELPRGENGQFGTDVIVLPKDRMMAVNSKGEARVHPYVEEYQRAIERRARFAKLCIDAGIAERQIRIMEEQVQMAQRALDATLESLGLDAVRRQEARRTYARHLRAVA